MSSSEYTVAAELEVSGMDRAREFYEGELGLQVGIDSGDKTAVPVRGGNCDPRLPLAGARRQIDSDPG